MSDYYIAKKTRNLFVPGAKAPFRLSRSKLELFLNCPRCFYLDRRLGVAQPPGFPFNLNSAVDHLLKKEFDAHRAHGIQHPLQKNYGIDAIPYAHAKLDIWRENFKGVEYHHQQTNFLVTGAVDDLWVNPQGEIIIVDYKATSKDSEVNLDAEWQRGYKNQMEIYQWLFRMNGFEVSNTGYFVYCNGKRDREAFDAKLEFDVKLIPYQGNTDWVEQALMNAFACLMGELPPKTKTCDFCAYREAAAEVEGGNVITAVTITEKKLVKRIKSQKTATSSATLF